MSYRYEHFTKQLIRDDMTFHSGPSAGEPMPDFELATTSGGTISKRKLLAGLPFLMALGSYT